VPGFLPGGPVGAGVCVRIVGSGRYPLATGADLAGPARKANQHRCAALDERDCQSGKGLDFLAPAHRSTTLFFDLGQHYAPRCGAPYRGWSGNFMAKPLVRRLLRRFGNFEIWWVEYGSLPREQWPTVRYIVSAGDSERTFDRPHEAWAFFRGLTGPRNEDVG